jgi:hypothetical protein
LLLRSIRRPQQTNFALHLIHLSTVPSLPTSYLFESVYRHCMVKAFDNWMVSKSAVAQPAVTSNLTWRFHYFTTLDFWSAITRTISNVYIIRSVFSHPPISPHAHGQPQAYDHHDDFYDTL